MKRTALTFSCLSLTFALLMSLPWLVPQMGWTALVGIVPLLVMERLASAHGVRHFWWWQYGCFVLWNAATTWWIGGATVGGAVFAVLANALQMAAIFGSFRWVKRRTRGVLPYLYLAAAWIAWERYYLTVAQISWPWLVLGNAFADTTSLVQWYSVLGTLGGSLWIWCSNLAVFGIMTALSDGRMARWNAKARTAAFAGALAALFGPMVWSACLPFKEEGTPLKVLMSQPNYDPYEKKGGLPQSAQDTLLLQMLERTPLPPGEPALVLAPETFTRGMLLDDVPHNPTFLRFRDYLEKHPGATFIFGASTFDQHVSHSAPSPLAYDRGSLPDGRHLWWLAHNSAIATDTTGRWEIYHKSKLVIGTELTPYPAIFVPLEKALFGGPMMGKDIPQEKISCLHAGKTPVGVPICYESVYGEFCTGFVREGAQLLAVITNDAWWGDTPGHRQHLNYSRLRAIETRRWVARSANTGISAVIDPRGNILERTAWWEPAVLEGNVQLLSGQTPFVRYGDMVGRVAVFLFLLLGAAACRPSGEKKLKKN